MTNEKGITLIALIITIIVLLILAGVSINAVVGDNGVLSNAQKSQVEMEKAKFIEDSGMAYDDIYAENLEAESITMDEISEKLINEYGYKEEQLIKIENKNIHLSDNKVRLRPNNQKEITVTLGDDIVNTYFVLIRGKYYKINFDKSDINLSEGQDSIPNEEVLKTTIKSGNDIITTGLESGKVTIEGKDGQTGKAVISVSYGVLEELIDVKVNELLVDIGDVTVDGKVLENDWQYFYDDETDVYLIYDDYLENSAIPRQGRIVVDGYRVYMKSGEGDRYLLTYYLNNNKTWKGFSDGVKNAIALKGVTINGDVTTVGSPDLELFKKSFDKIYGVSRFEIKYFESGDQNVDSIIKAPGYLYRLNGEENYSDKTYIDSNKKVFFPHINKWNETWGYWLTSLSAVGQGEICYVDSVGCLNRRPYSDDDRGVRPVVKIPKSNELTELLKIDEIE